MREHGWFVLVRGLEGRDQWECAYTQMFDTKRAALRELNRYRQENNGQVLSFHLAKASVVSARDEVSA